MTKRICTLIFMVSFGGLWSQTFPASGDNIDYLVTSGKDAGKTIGDDDHQQVVFFMIPKSHTSAFYIRIFDPEVGGNADEINGTNNSTTSFTCYGGAGTYSDTSSRSIRYQKTIKGVQLSTRTFGNETAYDGKWYSMGPFNPSKGEYDKTFDAYIFKVVINGKTGDDVNLYKLALSTGKTSNVPITGGNIFTYEYSFRLKSKSGSVAHVYPYVDEKVASITQHNFDLDLDGSLKLYSSSKKGEAATSSGDGNWGTSKHVIEESEYNKCLDVQIIKKADWHNDVVMYVLNQYKQAVPFFASPIGGAVKPTFKFSSGK